jgi:hypothetical protein
MVLQLEPDSNIDRALAAMASTGWRLKTHAPILTSHGQGSARTIIFHGERIVMEKAEPEGMLDAELEALSTIVRAQLVNHEVQASMAAQHGDYITFYSPQFEMLMQELRRRGVIE